MKYRLRGEAVKNSRSGLGYANLLQMHRHPVHHVHGYDLGCIHFGGTLVYLLYGIPQILAHHIVDELGLGDHVSINKDSRHKRGPSRNGTRTHPSQGSIKSRSTYSMICWSCRSTVLPKIKGRFDGFLMGLGRSKMLLLHERQDKQLRLLALEGQSPALTWWHCRAGVRARDLVASAHWW